MKCPKCDNEMIEGFLVDTFANGATKKLAWANQFRSILGLINLAENPAEVKTYKCKNCGYLESYAK